ncbi:serine/threonine protein kinase [Streptomyces rapamycinicus]|uniref:serine/threonine protein kinase n=1 Tax=Streptomyces rapamycinicus TaxID=1226757 RepID=UPI0032D8E492
MEPPILDRRTGRTDHDTPRRADHDGGQGVGPYRILATLDVPGHADDARRCLARDTRTGRTVVLALPPAASADDAGYRVRFRAEAENSRRLPGPWAAPVVDVAPPEAELPWVAHDCFPALTLPAALAAHGGPLPEDTVRALGAALAETLAVAHANGLVHAGISPQAVLLTREGPRLTGYGLVRAATGIRPATPHGGRPATSHLSHPATAHRDQPALPPEQRAGEPPRPYGDVYALGAVLAYAATGRKDTGPAALPPGLREPIAACLSPDPAHRPQPDTLAREFRSTPAPATPGRVPDAVEAALAEQAAHHPAEIPPPDVTEAAAARLPRAAAVPALRGRHRPHRRRGLALGSAERPCGGPWRTIRPPRPSPSPCAGSPPLRCGAAASRPRSTARHCSGGTATCFCRVRAR